VPSDADRSRRRSAGAILVAAALWGTTGTAQELGAPEAAPTSVAAVRTSAGGLCFVALLVLLGRWPALRLTWRRAAGPTLGAAVAMAVFQVGYLTGVRQLGVALGTVLAIGSAPAFAGSLALVGGRRPTARWAVATAVTVAGAAVLLLTGDGAVDAAGAARLGAAAALTAGLGYAGVATLAKRALDRGADGSATMALVFLGAGVALVPLAGVGGVAWLGTREGLATAAWLALGPTVLAYVLYGRGLAGVDAPTATSLSLAEPLTAAILAVAVVGERPTPAGWVGAGLVACGLLVLALRPPGRRGTGGPVHGHRRRH
jgi:DME family drug/metabolite transporter